MTRHYLVGDVAYPEANLVAVESGKPVVVIDPDDREAVRELLATYGRQFTHWTPELDSNVTRLQAALRELANPKPPKPDEPTGLGAVVEDAEGRRWVRTENVPCWYATGYGIESWGQVDAVRVLSEGVQA